jgi:uncharacterized protein (DUF305 family)
MRIRTLLLVIAAACGLAAATAQAQSAGEHHVHDAGSADQAVSTRAFRAAAAVMHKSMDIPYTGKADVDFVRGMIPHHEGAIAMARIELEHGTDPAIRKLAEAIIKAQEAEIAEMRAWLAAHAR